MIKKKHSWDKVLQCTIMKVNLFKCEKSIYYVVKMAILTCMANISKIALEFDVINFATYRITSIILIVRFTRKH